MLKFVRPSDPLSSKNSKPSGCVSEQSIASARASVMVYDDTSKKWIPSGTSSGLSKVHIFQNISNNTFRVVARKLQDHEVVINCIILKGLKYNQATHTFHQWRDNKQVYGLNFSSREDADGFARAMTHALDVLNSNSLPRPPPQPMTQQPQTHYQQANGTYDEDMGYSPMVQRTAIYHQVSPGGPTRLDSSPSASHSRTMTREDVAMIQERRMSTQSQRNNTLPRRKLDMNPMKRELPAVWCSPTASSTSLTPLGPEKESSYESILSEDSRAGLQDPINNGNASSPGAPVPPTPPGHHRTSSAPPAPQPPPMSLAPPPPPAPPAAPPCPPAPGMPPAAPPFGGVLAAPAPPFGGVLAAPAPPFGGVLAAPAPPFGGVLAAPAPPFGGVLAAAAPPPPPPPPGPGLPRSSSNDGNDTSSLAAQLQSAKLRRSNKQSAENSGSSTSSSGSGGPGYGTLGRGGTGMASMMDEMAKTLARRRAAAEKVPDPGPREPDYGTAERKNSTWGGSNAKMGNGCESSPKPSRRPLASSEESLPKVNGDTGLSELEAVKQEILREMRREINKMKTDIIEALKTELNRR